MIARAAAPLRFPGLCLVLVATGLLGAPTPIAPALVAGLVWRNIGPFRGGWTAAGTRAGGQPGGVHAGLPLGRVVQNTLAGQAWDPVLGFITRPSSARAIQTCP